MDVSKEENVIPVRKSAGMVFQNPANQIIANVVEEDVGFGPENIGVQSTNEVTIKEIHRTMKLERLSLIHISVSSPQPLV